MASRGLSLLSLRSLIDSAAQYATAHLDHEILVLRDFIASLSPSAAQEGAVINASEAAQTLTNIKREVVETIRRVVDVVSKYAGAALPEHAKRFVRHSILSLPAKWTRTVQQRDVQQQQQHLQGAQQPMSALTAQTQEAAERVLSFAVESLDMLRGVTHIFGDSVERAEAWVSSLPLLFCFLTGPAAGWTVCESSALLSSVNESVVAWTRPTTQTRSEVVLDRDLDWRLLLLPWKWIMPEDSL